MLNVAYIIVGWIFSMLLSDLESACTEKCSHVAYGSIECVFHAEADSDIKHLPG